MTLREAIAHLHARVVVQKHQRDNRTRNRWTLRDLDAVETLIRAIDKAARKR